MSNAYDVVIIGAGIAGMKAATTAAKYGLSYKIIEANDYIGGRILTQTLDLSRYQDVAKVPATYKFEHGAGWIHGAEGNPLAAIFRELFAKHEPETKFEDQLVAMFPGNAWIMPEYTTYDTFTMVDGPTCHQLNRSEYDMYIAIVCVHLRTILRKFNGLKLAEFVQVYMEWIAQVLAKNAPTAHCAEILARAVGWYFHSVESYSGTSKGVMSASDLFVSEATAEPLVDDCEYNIMEEILTEESAVDLITAVNNASDLDVPAMIEEYKRSPFYLPDAALQGCYLGDHSTLKCGMTKLVQLFQKEIEADSKQPLNIDLRTKVVRVSYPGDEARYIDVNANISQDELNAKMAQLTTTQYNAAVHTVGMDSNVESVYYATKGIVCTASIHSLMRNIQFPPTSEVNEAKTELWDTTSSVYYKKVLFCFPEMWWDHKQFTRIFALTQDAINFKTQRCKHCLSSTRTMNEEEYTSLDVSQGGYPCIMASAQEELTLTSSSSSSSDDEEESNISMTSSLQPPVLMRDSTLDYIDRASSLNFSPISFCGVNMIWESHIYNKQTPVLSASIVGNFAQHLVGVDDNLVKMIVFKQLEKIYRSTVALKRAQGDFEFPSCIPKPLWSRITHWAENPTILQSYSLITDCSLTTEERVTLAADQHIYFSGEHINVAHGGSVHGCLETSDIAMSHILTKYCGITPVSNGVCHHGYGAHAKALLAAQHQISHITQITQDQAEVTTAIALAQ